MPPLDATVENNRGLWDVGVDNDDDVGAMAAGVEPELRWARKNGLDGSDDAALAIMALARVGLSGTGVDLFGTGSTGSFLCLVSCAHKCICDR